MKFAYLKSHALRVAWEAEDIRAAGPVHLMERGVR
jgi:hypothetical protein